MGCILEWAYAVEALARFWHGGWSNAYALVGAMGECEALGCVGCGGVPLGMTVEGGAVDAWEVR